MGDMTLANFRTEVRALLDEASDFPTSDNTRLDRYINWSYRQVCLPNVFKHLACMTTSDLTLADGTEDYTYPATIYAIDHLYYLEQEYTLRWNTQRQMDRLSRTNSSGAPTDYSVWGTGATTHNITLYPTPGSSEAGDTVTIYGFLIPTALSAVGDSTILTEHWDPIICEGAAWRGWKALGNPGRGDYHRREFADQINDIRSSLDINQLDYGGDNEVIMPEYQTR